MTTLDPAYCADGCGRLAETERPATGELVCSACCVWSGWLDEAVQHMREHSSDHGTLEDR